MRMPFWAGAGLQLLQSAGAIGNVVSPFAATGAG
jgi:hypothetical protein